MTKIMLGNIKINGLDYIKVEEGLYDPVDVDMWYDRHYKHWVIYPIDRYGNQTHEARYGFGKREAEEIKREILDDISKGKFNND